MKNNFQRLMEQSLIEAQRQSTKKFQDEKYEIWHQPPKGYFAKGLGLVKKAIKKEFFDKQEDAEEHAELEIGGFLDKG